MVGPDDLGNNCYLHRHLIPFFGSILGSRSRLVFTSHAIIFTSGSNRCVNKHRVILVFVYFILLFLLGGSAVVKGVTICILVTSMLYY